MWSIDFISHDEFKTHVQNTILQYGEKLKPYDVKKFNSNIIDPIKMVFDKAVYGKTWEELISSEIFRQRDKANTNDIGYFHQRIFQYINGCHVPDNGKEGGWDVIVEKPQGFTIDSGNTVHRIFVEMKNKHNTMNSASSGKTYMKMQNQLLIDDDCVCMLVEAIAAKSQNIVWKTTVDGRKMGHTRIRRVSMDKFYEIATGEADAFHQICMVLPSVVQDVINDSGDFAIPHDTVIEELRRDSNTDDGILIAMYLLGFGTYNGFE